MTTLYRRRDIGYSRIIPDFRQCANCVCVIRLDMTTPPWWREKVMVYYYIMKLMPLLSQVMKIAVNINTDT